MRKPVARRSSNTNQKNGDKKVAGDESEAATTAVKKGVEKIDKEPIDPQRI